MGTWNARWVWTVWEILGILMFLRGYFSGNVVTMIVGIVMAFADASLLLTSFVSSAHIVKRALEVVFVLLAFGVVIAGYIVTQSLILGIMTLFIVIIIFVAFGASYLRPKLRGNPT